MQRVLLVLTVVLLVLVLSFAVAGCRKSSGRRVAAATYRPQQAPCQPRPPDPDRRRASGHRAPSGLAKGDP
jgi:hypothetical protein